MCIVLLYHKVDRAYYLSNLEYNWPQLVKYSIGAHVHLHVWSIHKMSLTGTGQAGGLVWEMVKDKIITWSDGIL